jgi:Ran GTPase-activating protein (RanGAP) involved in mRNA processing and transport
MFSILAKSIRLFQHANKYVYLEMQKGLLDLLNAIDGCLPRVSKLDISFNELNLGIDENLCSRIESFRSLTHLNLNGNKLGEKVSS